VDAFFSRVERIIKTLLKSDSDSDRRRTDSFYSEAWEELEEYLRTGEERPRSADDGAAGRDGSGGAAGYQQRPQAAAQDYRNLELEPGADFATVKQAYRRLMRTYHPDRYAHDPERQRIATEISAKLNASFNRIREASATS
jgi:DnaJ-domain-containing protein 1